MHADARARFALQSCEACPVQVAWQAFCREGGFCINLSDSFAADCCRPTFPAESSATCVRQVGRQEPVMVLRVDKEKGYIDLSKRRVSPEDIAACEERYNRSKLVHGIVGHVAETCGIEIEELYQQVAWPLYKMYGHAFEAFKVRRPSQVHQRGSGRMLLWLEACGVETEKQCRRLAGMKRRMAFKLHLKEAFTAWLGDLNQQLEWDGS